MDKASAIAAVTAELGGLLDRMTAAAKASGNAASDPENKAESKYDTRGLETSYLAAGQAEQVRELGAAIEAFTPAAFPECSEAAPGALVEVDLSGVREAFLLAPAGGGLVVDVDGVELTVLTPEAPLRAQLTGLRVGDCLERPALKVLAVS